MALGRASSAATIARTRVFVRGRGAIREAARHLCTDQAAQLGEHMARLLIEAGAQSILEEVSRQRA